MAAYEVQFLQRLVRKRSRPNKPGPTLRRRYGLAGVLPFGAAISGGRCGSARVPAAMSDFDPAALAAIQTDEITMTITREEAEWLARTIRAGLGVLSIDHIQTAHYDDAADLGVMLARFHKTGVDPFRADICYCIQCGQIDEPAYHDPDVCAKAARGPLL